MEWARRLGIFACIVWFGLIYSVPHLPYGVAPPIMWADPVALTTYCTTGLACGHGIRWTCLLFGTVQYVLNYLVLYVYDLRNAVFTSIAWSGCGTTSVVALCIAVDAMVSLCRQRRPDESIEGVIAPSMGIPVSPLPAASPPLRA